MKMLSSTLENAQTRIEGFHFDARKQVLAYDDVLNLQRMSIYARRQKLLIGDETEVEVMLQELITSYPQVVEVIANKKNEFGDDVFTNIFRKLSLQMIDMLWVEHLEVMSYTRNSVNLRAYGQRDPLIEYRKEGTRLFKEMQQFVFARIAEVLPNLQLNVIEREEDILKKQSEEAQKIAGETNIVQNSKSPTKKVIQEPNRNDMVTVTDGIKTEIMKYKKAELLLKSGTWKIVPKI